MTTEFLHESHKHNDHQAVALLSENHQPGSSRWFGADMNSKTVTLRQLTSKNKPREFSMTADEASAFVEAWMQFQMNSSAYEMEEQLRKEQEELKEAERRLEVWAEIGHLAESVPGLEITAKQVTDYGWDVDDYAEKEVTRWDVKLAVPYYVNTSLSTVDGVFEAVKEAVDDYNKHLQNCEADEYANFYGYTERYAKECQTFLATHRAFLKEQEQRKEVVTAAHTEA